MRWIVVAFALMVSGCDDLGYPQESAADCGVSDRDFEEAMAAMKKAKPYSSRRVGDCEILNDDTSRLMVITKEEQESVNRSIAAESAQ